ncbi:Sodium:neurotransmitter symporter-like protein 3 [Sarcoptes scabiei]|uniref:Sodium:neurotransmitter symporter-like protein 3 n=1 Tax=Sarcoptes scabiei TaxID=52283 RepID=A0A132AHF6_SARSC|nr:Sodium:neurotransmitter symporter-like protein 3 [Sarcoptes scabiei]
MTRMLRFEPIPLLYYVWCYISPACLIGILVFSIIDHKPPEYAGRPFPWYGEVFGYCIAFCSIIFIPMYMLYYLFYKSNQKQTLSERFFNGFLPKYPESDEEFHKKSLNKNDSNNNFDDNGNIEKNFS